MGLSVRVFGLSTWSILVPQALMGVATVGARLRACAAGHRRRRPARRGVLALTPVAALMFRFNNPDALLVLLLMAPCGRLRAVEGHGTRWLVLAGALVGSASSPSSSRRSSSSRARRRLPGGGARPARAPDPRRVLAVGRWSSPAGWWVALVELWPAASRPYVGGSQNNSFLELTFGYNGFGRMTGSETGSRRWRRRHGRHVGRPA